MKGIEPGHRALIAAAAPFAGIAPAALDAVIARMEVLDLDDGDTLVRQGDAGDRLYVVLAGSLEVVLESPDRPAQPLGTMGPGDVIGEIALLAGGERSATVRAHTPARLASLARGDVADLLMAGDEIARPLVELIAARLRRTQLAVHLGRLFGTIELAALRDVEATAEWVELRSGATLYRQGDPGDSVYVLVEGRLRVVAAETGGAESVLYEVGRGETVGELALLAHVPRSNTAYALRDTTLARFTQQAFEALAARYPAAAMQMTRLLGARLERMTAGVPVAHEAPVTIALVPAGRTPPSLDRVARLLVDQLARLGPARLLSWTQAGASLGRDGISDLGEGDPGGMRLGQWLAEQEATHRYVVYQADAGRTGWTSRCIRQADHVVLVADASGDPALSVLEGRLAAGWSDSRAPRRTLVLLHAADRSEPVGTEAWLGPRQVDDHVHVRLDRDADMARLARFLTGRAVCLVLGGGGARGLAHVGVIRAMAELGIPVDMVGGTSMGAVVGAARAAEWSMEEVSRIARERLTGMLDYTIPILSLISGRRVARVLDDAFGSRRIEDLWLPFFCVSTNLTRAERVIQRRGSLAHEIRISISLPGVMPPVWRDGDLLVDGGLLDNLPVEVMRAEARGGRVVAVDVSPPIDLVAESPFEPALSGWSLLADRVLPRRRRRRVPTIVGILNRTVTVPTLSLRRVRGVDGPDLALHPDVGRWGLFDFGAADAIAARGREDSLEPLRAWWEGQGSA